MTGWWWLLPIGSFYAGIYLGLWLGDRRPS